MYSPPGMGKTTVLRELARKLSSPPYLLSTALLDQRGELSAGLEDCPSLSVYLYYPKEKALSMALRTAAPDLIILDEIGKEECAGLAECGKGGVAVIASAHAAGHGELLARPGIAALLQTGMFDYLVGLSEPAPSSLLKSPKPQICAEEGKEMLKTAGLLLLALGAVLFGWRYGEKEKKKYRDLQFLLGLVDYIRNGILYSREELPSCFESYREIVPHDSLPFFRQGDYENALQRLYLDEKLKKTVLLFFSELGKGDAEEEEARCRKLISLLTEMEEKGTKELSGKVKVSRTLGICIGAVLLLLFL